MSEKTALVIGASRGVGLGLVRELAARGYRVIATQRSESSALREAAERYRPRIEIATCDVTEKDSVAGLKSECGEKSLDILVCNAGIYGSRDKQEQAIMQLDREKLAEIMMVNAVGPAQAIVMLLPLVKDGGRVGLLTSLMGSIADSSGGTNYYRTSKVAQNMLARSIFEDHAKARGIPVLSLHPGWVKTEMGGPNALISVEQSAHGLADRLEQERATGHRFLAYDGRDLPW